MSQDFTLAGTGFALGLDRVTAATVEGETPALAVVVDSDAQVTVSGALEALATLGAVPPFSFTFRAYQGAAATGFAESDPVEVTQGVVPANPLDDAQYPLQVDAPGSSPLAVGAYTLGYLPSPNPGDGAVTSFPVTVPPGANPAHTFAVWFSSINAPTAPDVFASCVISGAGTFEVEINNVLDLLGTDYTFPLFAAGPFAQDPTWHLLVVTRDGGDVYVYMDGVQVAYDSTGASQFNNTSAVLSVGLLSGPFNSIGTGAVWFRALTPTEVTDLFTLTTFPP